MSNNRKKQVLIRLTEAEKKALQEFATRNNTTIADVVRSKLFEYGETIIRVNVKP